MSLNRIQKLLFSEYCDFEDMVLVESPFAQTTREGLGLRQVQLGLTPTKLVLAIDVLPPVQEAKIFCTDEIDPEIETLELIAVYPVECVNLSVYRRRKRQSLKAHFCNNRVLYFELGGFEKRKMFWNLWCERVRFLCPEDGGSSVSETSVATSTSTSTLNVISALHKINESGKSQFWCKFGNNKVGEHKCKWVEQYLYMNEIKDKDDYGTEFCAKKKNKTFETREITSNQQSVSVNNATQEVSGTGIFVNTEEFLEPLKQINETSTESTDVFTLYPAVSSHLPQLSENAVQNWENARQITGSRGRHRRHPRKYGLMPQSHFLYGLGPWNIHTGDRVSIQMKRSASAVKIRRQPDDPELSLPISKRLLTVSISCEAFHMSRGLNIDTCVSKLAIPGPKALLFWTPAYWYRPQPACDSYNEFLEYLRNIKKNLKENKSKARNKKKKFKKKKSKPVNGCGDGDAYKYVNPFVNETSFETYLCRLRTALKIEVALTAWDFDSTTLAYQLTMIDKELFLKIRPYELQVIMWQRSSKNAPNINSLVAFSHRVSCLVATEILRDDSDKIRSKLIVRFINAADKCDRIANYQSCRSILSGLQSIPIYRLHKTWAYLRLHHAIKYQLFENLCRRYSDPRMLLFQKSFYLATGSPPYLPYIGDILARVLDKVPLVPQNFSIDANFDKTQLNSDSDNEKENIKCETEKIKKNNSFQKTSTVSHKIIKFFSALKLWPTVDLIEISDMEIKKIYENKKFKNKNKSPRPRIHNLEICNKYEDNRLNILQDVTVFLNLCQKSALKYALGKNDLAQEYLLKARYREDRENFYNFKIEQ